MWGSCLQAHHLWQQKVKSIQSAPYSRYYVYFGHQYSRWLWFSHVLKFLFGAILYRYEDKIQKTSGMIEEFCDYCIYYVQFQ